MKANLSLAISNKVKKIKQNKNPTKNHKNPLQLKK